MNAESVNGEVGGVEQTAPTRPARGPLTLLLDTIGSVWFGVTMLFFILVYAWLGSAGLAPLLHWTAVREFEKTEMEWYAWWPFNAMIAAFSIALILVTLRKIKFSVFNLGVWVVHVGILVLVTGCLIYFGTKIEGDMLVYRHQAVISAGGGEPSTIVLRRGEQTQVKAPDGTSYSVEVMGFTPGYTLLTGEDKGKKTYSTRLSVSRAGGKAKPTAFVRQVLTGYPQYTEDVIPGKGRAIKTIGKRVVDDALDVKLIHAPARTLYLVEKMALLVRKVGTEAWTEYPMPDLPRYHEYLREPNDVRLPMSERDIRIRTIDQPIARGGEDAGGVGDGASFRVTGFLPYARPGALWEAGEDADAATATTEPAPNPYVRYRVKMGQAVQRFAMLAKDPQNAERTIGDVRMRFPLARGRGRTEEARAGEADRGDGPGEGPAGRGEVPARRHPQGSHHQGHALLDQAGRVLPGLEARHEDAAGAECLGGDDRGQRRAEGHLHPHRGVAVRRAVAGLDGRRKSHAGDHRQEHPHGGVGRRVPRSHRRRWARRAPRHPEQPRRQGAKARRDRRQADHLRRPAARGDGRGGEPRSEAEVGAAVDSARRPQPERPPHLLHGPGSRSSGAASARSSGFSSRPTRTPTDSASARRR